MPSVHPTMRCTRSKLEPLIYERDEPQFLANWSHCKSDNRIYTAQSSSDISIEKLAVKGTPTTAPALVHLTTGMMRFQKLSSSVSCSCLPWPSTADGRQRKELRPSEGLLDSDNNLSPAWQSKLFPLMVEIWLGGGLVLDAWINIPYCDT